MLQRAKATVYADAGCNDDPYTSDSGRKTPDMVKFQPVPQGRKVPVSYTFAQQMQITIRELSSGVVAETIESAAGGSDD
ncbi:hypothetical protein ACFQ7Z_33090 [Streptomyces virginiae]|uniref:hypothetical protein n=1 Tax=Streptomyces virginiae TaxID=1961 RepID=UPI0036B0523E